MQVVCLTMQTEVTKLIAPHPDNHYLLFIFINFLTCACIRFHVLRPSVSFLFMDKVSHLSSRKVGNFLVPEISTNSFFFCIFRSGEIKKFGAIRHRGC